MNKRKKRSKKKRMS